MSPAGASTPGPAADLIEYAAGVIVASRKQPHTAPYHWAAALWEAGMLVAPGAAAHPTPAQTCRICGGVNGNHDGASHDARSADMPSPEAQAEWWGRRNPDAPDHINPFLAPAPAQSSEQEVDQFDIRFQFQDGETFTIEQLRRGLGLFDDNGEVPIVVGKRLDDEYGDWIELGDDFRAEYEAEWHAAHTNGGGSHE